MPSIKVATFNIEWMNDWFTADSVAPAFRATFSKDGHVNNTDTTASRVADLIRDIDPDIIGIQEGPSRPGELALFVEKYLSTGGVPDYGFILNDSGSSQKQGVLFKLNQFDDVYLTPPGERSGLMEEWL